MKKSDIQLGMGENISRRDFLNGSSLVIGGALAGCQTDGAKVGAQDLPGYYPPALEGMRGSHPGSFEVAHQLRDGAQFEAVDSGEEYDLVVVGGGLSGLSAAYFYQQAVGTSARILILENHDDFGGHAKRNEFNVDGRFIIGYGGTMWIESPGSYPPAAKRLIQEVGIDTDVFYQAYDRELYQSLGLGFGMFFDEAGFGKSHLATGSLANPDVVKETPLSDAGKADVVRLFTNADHYLHDLGREAQIAWLDGHTYSEYLVERGGFGPEALKVVESWPRPVWATGTDGLTAMVAWSSGYPGFGDLELGLYTYDEGLESEPRIFHFPDGNATVARMLVRKMIPASAPGSSMEDIVTARFDYAQLDNPTSKVRIRLNSTVVSARHESDDLQGPVRVSYVRDGEATAITARQVVMACYHSVIPKLCPDMPEDQRQQLSWSLRAPLVYSNAVIRNWHSFVKLGIHRTRCPGGFHQRIALDYPVSMGGYECPKSPDEPIAVHMIRVPGDSGQSAKAQFTQGKVELLTTGFDVFERNIRAQLGEILGPGGFDPARDIAAITVNRWPHGYAYGYDPETDRVAFEPSRWPDEKRFWEIGSRRFGNISIAATDAASNAMTESAIEEAHRAVRELTNGG